MEVEQCLLQRVRGLEGGRGEVGAAQKIAQTSGLSSPMGSVEVM